MTPGLLVFIVVAAVVVLLESQTVVASAGQGPGFLAFAEAIAFAEGFYADGANIPKARNNPGDLKWGTTEITTFASVADGWAALYAELHKVMNGTAYIPASATIREFAAIYTATEQDAWTGNVVAYLRGHGYGNVTAETPVAAFLLA
jgi:hypothetical protein